MSGQGRDIHISVFIPRYKYVRVQGGIYIYLSSYQGINMSGSMEGYTYICLHTKV